ncbi:MAG TPA: NUDIX domain-containing protein [Anaerolineae bacterium]|nr:NUDIX domain-containing protein [Anaerolineae bacterium]
MSKEGVVIILEDRSGCIAMQLRDDRLDVVAAGQWGLFGGWIESNESPRDAVVREVEEELNCALKVSKLSLLESRSINWGVPPDVFMMSTHVFHYPVTTECDHAVLNEGQAFRFMQPIDLKDKWVVPHHWAILNDYWRTK